MGSNKKIPHSIVEIDTSLLKDVDRNSYEAIVYKLTVLEDPHLQGNWYVGSHLLAEGEKAGDGSYWGSYTSKELKRLISRGVPIRYEVLAYGDRSDMYDKEYEITEENKVSTNEKSFNKKISRKGSKKVPFSEERMNFLDELVEQIKKFDEELPTPHNSKQGRMYNSEELYSMGLNGDFQVNMQHIDTLSLLKKIQVRTSNSSNKSAAIAVRMSDRGDSLRANYILLMEMKKNNSELTNGNHTLNAAIKANKDITELKTLKIPHDFIKEYEITQNDQEYIAMKLNEPSEMIVEPTSKKDVIKRVYKFYKDGYDINSSGMKDFIKRQGFGHGNTVKSILNEVEYMIKKDENPGQVHIDYIELLTIDPDSIDVKALKSAVKKLDTDPCNRKVHFFNVSNCPKTQDLVLEWIEEGYSDIRLIPLMKNEYWESMWIGSRFNSNSNKHETFEPYKYKYFERLNTVFSKTGSELPKRKEIKKKDGSVKIVKTGKKVTPKITFYERLPKTEDERDS